MEPKIKLPKVQIECFVISLQTYQTKEKESENIGLNSFPKKKSSDTNGNLNIENQDFFDFFRAFVKSFNKKFAVYRKEDKGVFVSKSNLKINSGENIIYGIVEGGTTNVGTKFKTQDNTTDEDAIPISPKHVDAHPYYFLLWFPPNKEFGYLIIQRLSSKSITGTFKKHLTNFVKNEYENVYLLINQKTPKEISETIKFNSLANKITLTKKNIPAEIVKKILNIDYEIDNDLTLTLTISGIKKLGSFQEKINDSLKNKNKNIIDFDELKNIGFHGHYKTAIEYDHNGSKNTVTSDNEYKFKPRLYLNEDEFVRDENFQPTFESLHEYCFKLLNKLTGEKEKIVNSKKEPLPF